MGLADGGFGLVGGLGHGGMAQDQANRRNLLPGQIMWLGNGINRAFDREFDAKEKPKTIRQKLQAETNEWLKDVFV
jgi:hypothetical protein